MRLEEISDRLEFLESQCILSQGGHGPWKLYYDAIQVGQTTWTPTPRCIKCGAPADHQLEKGDLVP